MQFGYHFILNYISTLSQYIQLVQTKINEWKKARTILDGELPLRGVFKSFLSLLRDCF
ncbi:hypothetical protein CLU83_1060 [Flavobacterium sp. 1]|nr:hypothetical protein CLU83_1060 [Flavobacterium sp. 1]